jgi:hypothetical protein
MDQGSKTFGAEILLPMLREVYGVEPNEEGFIDLNLVANPATGEGWSFGDTPVYVPKVLSRGKVKGQKSVIRRENSVFYVLHPDMETAGKVQAEAQEVAADTEEQVDQEIIQVDPSSEKLSADLAQESETQGDIPATTAAPFNFPA